MFVVRNTFIAKPGCASKLAAQLKEAVTAFQMPGGRVMTDVYRRFQPRDHGNTLLESLEEFEKRCRKL
jgi:hypothetical protein